ncbi:hypothetical protein RO3G_02156 [Lichtheimia corymbifera JMRC:FSU:9682]|uniref:PH domain-containing protein n=1 Tax=Lichtheimia corymbifera JMRC:FSU:9682 TaxID=1263082 RepID=A0A068SGI7_9FUNG|nr:hypothetical protein RO3G_02156 [Lichtheimia corymbifera JMRC:FSU:9682]
MSPLSAIPSVVASFDMPLTESKRSSLVRSLSLRLSRRNSDSVSSLASELDSVSSRRASGVFQNNIASGSKHSEYDIKGKSRAVDEEIDKSRDPPSTPTTPLSPHSHTLPRDHPNVEQQQYNNLLDVKPPPRSLTTLNRAQVIIDRLEGWLLTLREISIWLEEAAKINMQSSQAYYHRALEHVDWSDTRRVPRGSALCTMVGSLRFLTAQVASRQHEAAEKMQREYLGQLDVLRKECKMRLNDLVNNGSLRMDELVKRAETTRKHMLLLDKLCQAADMTQSQVANDPWLENLLVLRSLKRELDEDNRLRLLMITIQHQMAELERRIIQALTPAIQYCYSLFVGELGSNRGKSDLARYRQLIDNLDPQKEWSKFMNNESDLIVDDTKVTRNHLEIKYNNMAHPAVMTLYKGTLYRQLGGVRNKTVERYCVLTQCGFLHEFSVDGKIHPEISIYVPKATIIPSIDISYLAQHPDDTTNDIGGNYTIRILRSPGGLQREKSYLFLVNTRLETLEWGRALVDVATRHKKGSPSWKRIKRRSTVMEPKSSYPATMVDGNGLKRSATQPHARRDLGKPVVSDRRASVPHITQKPQSYHDDKEDNESGERKEPFEKERNNTTQCQTSSEAPSKDVTQGNNDSNSNSDRLTAPEDSIPNANDELTKPALPEDDTGRCYMPQLRHNSIEQSISKYK